MMRLLFPKWFARNEETQTAVSTEETLMVEFWKDHIAMKRRFDLLSYKDVSMHGIAHMLHMVHMTDQNHVENMTLQPEAIPMTVRYYNSKNDSMSCHVEIHDYPQWHEEKIYGKRETATVIFDISDDIAILPALKIAIAELIQQRNENEAKQ
jgi:hypothetical protein